MLGRYSAAVPLVLILTLVSGCARDAGPVAADEFQPVTPGVLTVVTDLPAPGFWQVEGESFVGGFEYALARSFADDLGLELEVRDVVFTDIVAGQVADYDLALAEITVTDLRAEVVDFTEPYLEADDGILTRSGLEVPDLATARDLEWGVVAGTTQEVLVNESVLPRQTATSYPNLETALEALESGAVEALLLDTPIALAEEARSAGSLAVPAQFDTGQNFAGVMPSGSPNRDVIDALIRRARSNGSLDEMRVEWLDPLLGRDPSTVPYLPLRTPRS